MTIDNYIALISSIGACLSALATFLTVRQIAKQREASYRPELSFSRVLFEAGPSPIKGGSLPEAWVTRTAGAIQSPPFEELSLPLRNVGLGTAKALSITWSFDIKSSVERANLAAQRTLTPAYFIADDTAISLESEKLGTGTSVWGNQRLVHVDYVLPASVQKEPVELKPPHAYIQMCSAVLYLECQGKAGPKSFEVPNLTATIEYSDIGSRLHSATFDFEVHIISLQSKGESFNGYVDCRKRV